MKLIKIIRSLYKIISSKLFLIVIILSLFFVINRLYNHPREVYIDQFIEKIDTVYIKSQVNTISIDTYKKMRDSLTVKIKSLQSELKIKNKNLTGASQIISNISDTVIARIDTVLINNNDSIHFTYKDDFTYIEANGKFSDSDSLNVIYNTSANLTAISYYEYKDAKTKLGRWWNRLFKIGKHEVIKMKSDNPHLDIKSTQILKFSK